MACDRDDGTIVWHLTKGTPSVCLGSEKEDQMASQFSVQLTMRESPSDAQARAATALSEPARALGLRLKNRGAGELEYRPRIKWPLLVTLWHNLNHEQMTVKFVPADSGGTRVTISGTIPRGRHALAADPQHWSEVLGGSSAVSG